MASDQKETDSMVGRRINGIKPRISGINQTNRTNGGTRGGKNGGARGGGIVRPGAHDNALDCPKTGRNGTGRQGTRCNKAIRNNETIRKEAGCNKTGRQGTHGNGADQPAARRSGINRRGAYGGASIRPPHDGFCSTRQTRINRARRICLALVAALAAMAVLAASGCGGNAAGGGGSGGKAGQTDADNGGQAGGADGGDGVDGMDGLPVTPPEDESDEPLDEQFVSLAETGAPVGDLWKFIRTFADQATPVELSAMLLILEVKQLEQGYALEDRFFEDETIQSELFEWYTKNQRLPKAEDIPGGAARELLEDVEEGGFKLETAEGFFFPVIDYTVYREFRSRVTEDVRAYIDLMAEESEKPAVKDAALIIPWEEVPRRALAFESFLAAYPQSARAAAADRLRMDYTYITFKGIDNSPLFEWEGGPVVEPVLRAYKKVLAEQGSKTKNGKKASGNTGGSGSGGGRAGRAAGESRYLADLREFVRLIESGGGKQTEEVRAFQEKVTEGLLDEYEERYGEIGEEEG